MSRSNSNVVVVFNDKFRPCGWVLPRGLNLERYEAGFSVGPIFLITSDIEWSFEVPPSSDELERILVNSGRKVSDCPYAAIGGTLPSYGYSIQNEDIRMMCLSDMCGFVPARINREFGFRIGEWQSFKRRDIDEFNRFAYRCIFGSSFDCNGSHD